MKKVHHVNTNQKQARVAVLNSDTEDFTPRKVIRDKEEHHTMTKGSIPQKDIRTLMCICFTIEHQYVRQKPMKLQGETESTITETSTIETRIIT